MTPTLSVTTAAPEPRLPRRRSRSSGMGRFHDLLAWALPLFVFLATVPLASNRPVLWLFNAGVLCLAGAAYFTRAALRRRPQPGLAMTQPLVLCLFAVLPLWCLVQAVPLLSAPLPGWTGLSALPGISVFPAATLLAALRLTSYLVLFVLVLETAARGDRARAMAWALFWAVFVHALFGLAFLNLLGDLALFGTKSSYLGAATGTFVNRNSFATFLGFGIVLGVALMLEPARGRAPVRIQIDALFRRAFLWSCIGLLFLCQLATQSRLGTASTVLAVLAVALVMRRVARRTGLRLLVGSLVLVAVLAAGLAGAGLLDRFVFTQPEGLTRIDLYRQILPMIELRPLTGFGIDCFELAFEMFRQPGLLPGAVIDRAHNTYLGLWAEGGLIAGSAPMVAFGVIAWKAGRGLGRLEHGTSIPAAGVGAIVLTAAHSLGDFSLEIPANAYVLTVIAALALARVTPARDA